MAVVRWGSGPDMLARLGQMQREMDQIVSGVRPDSHASRAQTHRASVYPPMNVYNDGETFIVRAEVPGVEPSTLDLEVVGDTVTVRGERTALEIPEGASYHRRERDFGRFRRALTLPEKVDNQKVIATCKDGILEIRLPHAEEAKARKISIGVS